jgi:hypothetical protein
MLPHVAKIICACALLVGLAACGDDSSPSTLGDAAPSVRDSAVPGTAGGDDGGSAPPDDGGTAAQNIEPGTCSADSCPGAVKMVGIDSRCVRDASGEVLCQSGELADRRLEPMGIFDAVELVAGYQHACALRATGRVACWGTFLRPGGETLQRDEPVDMELDDVVQLASRYEFYMLDATCALQRNGETWCWGGWNYGFAPEREPAFDDAALLATASTRACALREARLVCQDGGNRQWSFPLAAEDELVELSLNWNAGCARAGSGALRCFNLDAEIPDDIEPELPLSAQLTSTPDQTCSLSRAREVHCIGRTFDGAVHVLRVAALDGAIWLFEGEQSICGLYADGAARCVKTPELPSP